MGRILTSSAIMLRALLEYCCQDTLVQIEMGIEVKITVLYLSFENQYL